ncbi:MAG: hypothetical protein LBF35_20190, partial [Methylobacterium sp.]|nr:hypothetical protein [Methylobacterium sp.]
MRIEVAGGTVEAVPPQLRARLAARFPNCPRWAPPVEALPAPWELIREVLACPPSAPVRQSEALHERRM